MSEARDAIMVRIRQELRGVPSTQRSLELVTERLAKKDSGPIPMRGSEGLARFIEEAEAVQASIDEVQGTNAVPEAVAAYLSKQNLGPELRRGVDPYLDQIPWSEQADLRVTTGPVRPTDRVCLSLAVAGIAETGSVVLTSGEGTPAALNFLPETHIVLLPKELLFGCYEELWRFRREAAAGDGQKNESMPRLLCWITGPSRSADIEQTLVLGAHGPQHLHIILVGP